MSQILPVQPAASAGLARLPFLSRLSLLPALALLALLLEGAGQSVAPPPAVPPEEAALRETLQAIVRQECDRAFELHGRGVLEPSQLVGAIVPMIVEEVTRRAVPLILEKKRDDGGSSDLVVATVAGDPVRLGELRVEMARMAPALRKSMLDPEKMAGYLDEILIPKRLLLARAEAAKLPGRREVKRQLQVAFDNLLAETFLKRKSDELRGALATRFTDAETRDYYRDNLERLYQTPPRVALAHIVKRFPAGDAAARDAALETMKKAAKDLEDGVTFETVARKYSDDTRVLLGRFRKDEPVRDPVVRLGLTLMLGRHSEIVEGADGWHIVMVREMEEARTIPFEEARKNIVASLAGERLAGEMDRWVRDLRASHEIEIVMAAVTAEVGILQADLLEAPPEAQRAPAAKKTPDPPRKETAKERRAREERERKAAREKRPEKPPKPHDPNDDVLARVDGSAILRREFHEYLEQVPGRYAEMMTSPEGRLSILERLINKRVVLARARAERFERDPAFLDAYRDLEAKILTKNLILEEVASRIKVTDKEIDDYFARHPEEVKARHILISLPEGAPPQAEDDALARATTVLERAKAGEDFAALARECSDDPSRVDGGYLGFFSHDAMVEPFAKQAFAMKPGEVSPLVRTPYGFHVIKVEDRRMRERTEEARRHVRDRVLAPARQNESFRRYMEDLRGKAGVTIDRAALERAVKEGLLEK